MKIRIVLTQFLLSFALVACSLLFVARPVNAIGLEASDTALLASENGQYASELAEDNAFTQSTLLINGNIMPGPRNGK